MGDLTLTPAQALTTAVVLLRRHAKVCGSRRTETAKLIEAADLIETAVANHERLTAALDGAGLLQSEYPDQMAQASCTCERDAICGAHRLLARYDQLFNAYQQSNREKRDAKRKLRELNVLALSSGSPATEEGPTDGR